MGLVWCGVVLCCGSAAVLIYHVILCYMLLYLRNCSLSSSNFKPRTSSLQPATNTQYTHHSHKHIHNTQYTPPKEREKQREPQTTTSPQFHSYSHCHYTDTGTTTTIPPQYRSDTALSESANCITTQTLVYCVYCTTRTRVVELGCWVESLRTCIRIYTPRLPEKAAVTIITTTCTQLLHITTSRAHIAVPLFLLFYLS